ncbi:MAG: hypothetical protein QOD49_560, partial [Actinomycetota bacterium]|nr:hypothetical protein [Actinomycetota bacterium]
VTRVTENLLAAFGAGPAGNTHPSTGHAHSMPTGIASLSPPATGPSPSPKASRKKH